ncbi:MAG TPA: hypothetical protein VM884_02730 [Flavisolibacter sp.]|jgi:hypothetical protein|nr:hypothetical protein [Flavisolibacter sp.]
MKSTTVLAGGLAGAVTVTLLHESIRRVAPQAPRMDRLGMQAISKGLKKAGLKVPKDEALFTLAMAGDLVSNAIYYSAAGIGSEKNIWVRGSLLGLAAGIGAVLLPKPLGLNESHSNKTVATQVMTVGLYVTGALVSTAVIKLLNKKKQVKHDEWEQRLMTSAMG